MIDKQSALFATVWIVSMILAPVFIYLLDADDVVMLAFAKMALSLLAVMAVIVGLWWLLYLLGLHVVYR